MSINSETKTFVMKTDSATMVFKGGIDRVINDSSATISDQFETPVKMIFHGRVGTVIGNVQPITK